MVVTWSGGGVVVMQGTERIGFGHLTSWSRALTTRWPHGCPGYFFLVGCSPWDSGKGVAHGHLCPEGPYRAGMGEWPGSVGLGGGWGLVMLLQSPGTCSLCPHFIPKRKNSRAMRMGRGGCWQSQLGVGDSHPAVSSEQAAVWSRPWKLRLCTPLSCWDWRSARGPWTLGLMQVRARWLAARQPKNSGILRGLVTEPGWADGWGSSLYPGGLTWPPASVWAPVPSGQASGV